MAAQVGLGHLTFKLCMEAMMKRAGSVMACTLVIALVQHGQLACPTRRQWICAYKGHT